MSNFYIFKGSWSHGQALGVMGRLLKINDLIYLWFYCLSYVWHIFEMLRAFVLVILFITFLQTQMSNFYIRKMFLIFCPTMAITLNELEAGGKPSTWLPPGGLVELSSNVDRISLILIVLDNISSVCDEKYLIRRILMSSFIIWKNLFNLTSPHWEFLILLVRNILRTKMLNIALYFSTLKSDSQSKRIADSIPRHRKDPGKTIFIKNWMSGSPEKDILLPQSNQKVGERPGSGRGPGAEAPKERKRPRSGRGPAAEENHHPTSPKPLEAQERKRQASPAPGEE